MIQQDYFVRNVLKNRVEVVRAVVFNHVSNRQQTEKLSFKLNNSLTWNPSVRSDQQDTPEQQINVAKSRIFHGNSRGWGDRIIKQTN